MCPGLSPGPTWEVSADLILLGLPLQAPVPPQKDPPHPYSPLLPGSAGSGWATTLPRGSPGARPEPMYPARHGQGHNAQKERALRDLPGDPQVAPLSNGGWSWTLSHLEGDCVEGPALVLPPAPGWPVVLGWPPPLRASVSPSALERVGTLDPTAWQCLATLQGLRG